MAIRRDSDLLISFAMLLCASPAHYIGNDMPALDIRCRALVIVVLPVPASASSLQGLQLAWLGMVGLAPAVLILLGLLVYAWLSKLSGKQKLVFLGSYIAVAALIGGALLLPGVEAGFLPMAPAVWIVASLVAVAVRLKFRAGDASRLKGAS
jgi:hypothetical protein